MSMRQSPFWSRIVSQHVQIDTKKLFHEHIDIQASAMVAGMMQNCNAEFVLGNLGSIPSLLFGN